MNPLAGLDQSAAAVVLAAMSVFLLAVGAAVAFGWGIELLFRLLAFLFERRRRVLLERQRCREL